jgi:5-methylcytosine-specific restriction endonuclease McrA
MKTENQLKQLAEARKRIIRKPLSEDTKKKIGDANRTQVNVLCAYCNSGFTVKPSKLNKNKRVFCCRECYYKFVSEKMAFTERNSYKGVRKDGQTKQVYHRNYCKRHPKRISHLKASRYAREKGAVGNHSLEEWENMKIEFDNKCAFCRKQKDLTKDHIIPLSEGGTDYIDNIQPLCRNCNSKKWKHINYNPLEVK